MPIPGAKELIHHAVDAELQELLAQHCQRKTATGPAEVVRTGYDPLRDIQTGISPVTLKIPKVRAKSGEPVSFRSARVPPYVRKSRSLETALPWLYLKGVSSGEMNEALSVLVGPQAKGLSASTVSRLKQGWSQPYRQWRTRALDRQRWVYIWATGFTAVCAVIRTSCAVW